jgi:phospholipase C
MVSGTFKGGNSQHPMDGVPPGEALLKATYEAIRNSPHWNSSLLIVTWDEHGGFFDHATPPPAIPPGDTAPLSKYNQYGFTFAQYGVRVPAIIVSPYIQRNVIDHRLYDYSSIPATIEEAFDLPALTARDKAANSVMPLVNLANPVYAQLARHPLYSRDAELVFPPDLFEELHLRSPLHPKPPASSAGCSGL